MITVAGSTFAFGEMNLEDSCDVLKGLGFDTVDVGASGWSTFTAYVPQQVGENPDDTDGEADNIRRVTESKGLAISELFIVDFGTAINHPGDSERARSRDLFGKFAAIAGKAGFESVMMIPGNVHEEMGQSYEQAFDLSVEELTWMVGKAQEHGVQLNIEPCLIAAVPGLACTVDYAHQVQIGLTNEGIQPLHDLARHFHVKQSAEGEFEVKSDADNGAIDFQRMMIKLKADGYDGVVTGNKAMDCHTSVPMYDISFDTVRGFQAMGPLLQALGKKHSRPDIEAEGVKLVQEAEEQEITVEAEEQEDLEKEKNQLILIPLVH